MKKLIVILAVLALAMPSMATTTLTGSSTGMTATIGYSYDGTGSRPRAFALRIQTSAGTISAVTALKPLVSGQKVGLSTATSPGYGIFPGTIVFDVNSNVTDYNTPVEKAALRGSPSPQASGTGIGTNAVVVALASLYVGDANKPLNTANLMTVTVSGSGPATLTITPEVTARGGVVGEDSTTLTLGNASQTLTVGPLSNGPPDCVKNTAPFYNDWCSFGKPSCWCFLRNCKGDADGLKEGSVALGYKYVYGGDLSVLTAAWNKLEPTKGSGINGLSLGTVKLICADFDHLKEGSVALGYKRVYGGDLTLLTANWNKLEPTKGSGIGTCSGSNYVTQY